MSFKIDLTLLKTLTDQFFPMYDLASAQSLMTSEEVIRKACHEGSAFFGGNDGLLRGIGFPSRRLPGSGHPHFTQSTWFDYPEGPRCYTQVYRTESVPRPGSGGFAVDNRQIELQNLDEPAYYTMPPAVFNRVWDAVVVRETT